MSSVKSVKYLGYGGLAPFLLALAGIIFSDVKLQDFYVHAFTAYSAVILSFIGAVHWGFILKNETVPNKQTLLSISVIPALIGWLALLFSPVASLFIFALAFPAVFLYERFSSVSILLPEWYMLLRIQLTLAVTIMQFAAIAWSMV
ncbi:MAG: DUF3429 domain-containing protein [Pseudomonadota bacterium]